MSVDLEFEVASLKRRVSVLEAGTLGGIVGKLIGPRPRSTPRSVVSFSQAQARQRARRRAALNPAAFLNQEGWLPSEPRGGALVGTGANGGKPAGPPLRPRVGLFGRALAALWSWGKSK
jgi:hypothetical protein